MGVARLGTISCLSSAAGLASSSITEPCPGSLAGSGLVLAASVPCWESADGRSRGIVTEIGQAIFVQDW